MRRQLVQITVTDFLQVKDFSKQSLTIYYFYISKKIRLIIIYYKSNN